MTRSNIKPDIAHKLAVRAHFGKIPPVLPDEQTSPEQFEALRRMTPQQRWRVAHRLYWTARRHKAAFIQHQHPDWSSQQVDEEVRRIFLHARA